jgi:hypothetical protein
MAGGTMTAAGPGDAGTGGPVPGGAVVVRLLMAADRHWHAAFPGLHRRAQPQLVNHLATRGHRGSSVGELHGLVRQTFLLDDSTVKERIQEIAARGLCAVDPAEEALTTRSVVTATPALLACFDRYLLDLAGSLLDAAAALDPAIAPDPPCDLSPPLRALLEVAEATVAAARRATLDHLFDVLVLSPARRVEALRHLNATSHATLLLMALAHRYGVSPLADGGAGLLADRMAASLLELTGQNVQTTRDHIGYLTETGLLSRQPGKALRVALADAAMAPLDQAVAQAVAALPALGRRIAAAVPAVDPEELRTLRGRRPTSSPRHELVLVAPGAAPRRVVVRGEALVIGRLPPSDLVLTGADVSRRHCRVQPEGTRLRLADLGSTNGTFVGGQRIAAPVLLDPGMSFQVGPWRLRYDFRAEDGAADGSAAEAAAEQTTRLPARPNANKTGNSAD